MDFFDNINMDALQPLQDIFPDGWFDDVRLLYGESLSDEMISQSVEETCDFFHIDEPAMTLPLDYEATFSECNAVDWNDESLNSKEDTIIHDFQTLYNSEYDNFDDIDY